MGKGTTTLRIDSRISDEQLTELLKAIPSVINGKYDIVRYEHGKQDLEQHLYERAASLQKAFEFILKAWPSSQLEENKELKDTVINSLKSSLEAIKMLDNISPDNLEAPIQTFQLKICHFLKNYWPEVCKDDETAKDFLSCAEQYQLLLEDCPSIATLSQWERPETKEKHYLIQYDERLPSYNESWLEELKTLGTLAKNNALSNTPEIFRNLSYPAQVFLHGFFQKESLVANIEHNILGVISNLEIVLKELNEEQITCLNEALTEKTKPDALWFKKLPEYQQNFIMEFKSKVEIDEGLISLNNNIKSPAINNEKLKNCFFCLKNIPLWYASLPASDMQFFRYLLKDSEKSVDDLFYFLPSRLRRLPGLANFRETSIHLAEINKSQEKNQSGTFKFKRLTATFAGAHMASRDRQEVPAAVKRLYPERNLEHFLQTAKERRGVHSRKALVLTKVSPLPDPVIVKNPTPDKFLHKLLSETIAGFNQQNADEKVLFLNTPLNAWKQFDWTTPKTLKALLGDMEEAKNSLAASSSSSQSYPEESDPRVKALVEALRDAYSTWAHNNPARELMIGSLMVLIAQEYNIPVFGSCVSGKDREFIHSIMTGSIAILRALDKNKQLNVNIEDIAELTEHLYNTGHGKALATESGPGAWGTKHPGNYLPPEVCKRIENIQGQGSLKLDDRMATLIDPEKIQFKTRPDFTIIAQKIGNERCKKLIDTLHDLIGQKELFNVTKTYNLKTPLTLFPTHTPSGITRLNNLFYTPSRNQKTPIELCQEVMSIVYKRPEEPGDRTKATLTLYRGIRNLIFCPELADEIIEGFKTMYIRSLDRSSSDSKLSTACSSSSSMTRSN